MDLGVFVRGCLIGVSIAAPVGPIGVICIRRTLAEGRRAGLVSGLGAATADAIYGSIAAFGLALVANVLTTQQFWLRLIGGAFLCYLGVRSLVARPAAPYVPDQESQETDLSRANHDLRRLATTTESSAPRGGLLSAYASTFGLTLTNPMTILSFVAIYTGLGLGASRSDALTAGLMVLGVFAGSVLWWAILSTGAGLLRTKLTPGSLRWVNRVSGVIICTFGLVTLWSAIGR